MRETPPPVHSTNADGQLSGKLPDVPQAQGHVPQAQGHAPQ